MHKTHSKWRFAVDRGGTFTDVVGLDPSGKFHSLKLLSDSPLYKDASIEGIRRMIGLKIYEPLPENVIEGIRFGTTVATNALLERNGGKVALLITKGFADILDIGYQNRPDIFKLCIKKPRPLYSTVVEADERIDCHGKVIKKLEEKSLSAALEELKEKQVDAVAVVFMHAWKNPAHEIICERLLVECGFSNIVLSHRAINLIKIVSRGQGALIDAYLSPMLAGYLDEIKKETGKIPVEFMESSGMLSPPCSFTGKNALLSGPAGGVSAVAAIAAENGLGKVIGFDMGGTSTDVSRFDGEFERAYEKVIEGMTIQTEMLNIITVAAGGGSILRFDGQKMTVGPESAGSYPGPACYGFGGPLTITDANLLTGRLVPSFFPKTFGPDRNSPLETGIVKEKFRILTDEINASLRSFFTPQEVAAGFLRIANEKMALAIKEISVSRGFDVRDYTLVCFGGAGGQHACSIASLLDIRQIVIHPLGSVMSAYGIGLAEPARKASRTLLLPHAPGAHESLREAFDEIEEQLIGIDSHPIDFVIKREIDLRPIGADTFLTLPYSTFDETVKNFNEQYRRLFGLSPGKNELEIVNIRSEVRKPTKFFVPFRGRRTCDSTSATAASTEVSYKDNLVRVPLYQMETLTLPARVKGPAFIIGNNTTVAVDPDFEAEIDETGVIIMKRITGKKHLITETGNRPDPVLLEIFNNIFKGIATEMGITLKNTSYSVNIKERLDFSCAVFDAEGYLVANAPHIPVHLGSMADTVKEILKANRASMQPGDVYLTNNPYRGGSHLPDLTIVYPVFSEQDELIFFTASRGHHADIGGITPGSMPPFASHIDEEGVLLDNFLLVRNGSLKEKELREILTRHTYPVRNIEECISDLRAQIASCHKGMKELMRVMERYGLSTVRGYMRYIRQNAAHSVRKALYEFLRGSPRFFSEFEDYLDDGTCLKVSVDIRPGQNPPETLHAVIDFTGTGRQHIADNLNAPFSVTHSAVMYVLRALTDTDIPLNSGCLEPVEIIIPSGTILNPVYPAPVASGNVETSQRVVDVLLGAFGIAAASQGTMNNFLCQVEGEMPYYETIAGGSGALDGCSGASGVQVHMTNTRMTDPEILEFRHPGIRLERFSLRKNSGGKGKYPGGNGVIREIKFLKPATVSIVSERRVVPPYGVHNGESGAKGVNMHKKSDGSIYALGHREILKVEKDDSVIIETPGGGGYGRPG